MASDDQFGMSKLSSPLNITQVIDDEVLNQKTARILKNNLLLHEAVIKNEADSVRKVLKETPLDVNSRNNYGRAPIHWASSKGNTEIIELLLQAKCDIEARDKFGMRPLHMAALYGNRDAVKMLINAGGNVSALNKKQYTLLMCAARGSNLDVVEYLIEAVESLNVPATDCTGATALHHAAISGRPTVIEALTKIPRIEIDAIDKQGQTALHSACTAENAEAVRSLIELGANIDAQDNDGNTPLHIVTRARQTKIAELLLSAGANTALTDQMGCTATHVAASQGCRGILKSIIEHGAALNVQCKNGNTPLHLACKNNAVEIVEMLINKGVDLNSLNLRLQSPLHIAAEMGNREVCELLLAAGANIEEREQSGKTPLYIAARGSFTAIVDMIIKTARLDYPRPEDLTPVRQRWRKNSRDANLSEENGADSQVPEHVRSVLWKLAHKQLGSEDWKKLALHWSFTPEQIQAIEHQYTGPASYKEHGYRMLMIWLSSLGPDVPLTKELCDGLCAIDKKSLAESVQTRLEEENDGKRKSQMQRCHKCSIT